MIFPALKMTRPFRKQKMLRLPEKRNMEPVGDIDLDFLTRLIYNPISGIVYQQRYRAALSLIQSDVDRILEIGYGAGLLLPSLALRCRQLHGVDIHDKVPQVEGMLDKEGCHAELRVGSIRSLPFEGSFFDLMVCLSVLEHLHPSELPTAMAEMSRILRDGGHLVLGFPIKNRLTSFLFKAVGFDDQKGHPSSHRSIMDQVKGNFAITAINCYPSFLSLDHGLYVVIKCSK